MKPTFNIAINHAQDQEIMLTLEQDGKSGQKIILGDMAYSLLYAGDPLVYADIIRKLEETFTGVDTPVTKETLQHSLEPFGIVAVTTPLEKLQRSFNRAAILGAMTHQLVYPNDYKSEKHTDYTEKLKLETVFLSFQFHELISGGPYH